MSGSRKHKQQEKLVPKYVKTPQGKLVKNALPPLPEIDEHPENFEVYGPHTIFDDIIRLSQEDLIQYLTSFLFSYGYTQEKSIITKDYALFDGDAPILLIAHLDTVHAARVTKIYKNIQKHYLIAREGIGGDDRCGVLAIVWIITKGYRPYVLFTTDEEIGAVGARAAAKGITPSPAIRCMIEIDRKGNEDSVYYDNDNEEFKKYIDSFGFVEAIGSFSDISVLGDAWNIASVNLSSGYEDAHSTDEKIYLDQTIATAKSVMAMLDNPPEKRMEHVEKAYTKYVGFGFGFDVNGYYDELYDDFYGAGTLLTENQKDELAFKGIPMKHLDKSLKCFEKITQLSFISKLYAKDVMTKNAVTKMPFFSSSIDGKTHWIAEILKRGSQFYSMLTSDEYRSVQPCISYLFNIYKEYPTFSDALRRYVADPAKWKAFITEMHKKKPVQKTRAVMERFPFEQLDAESAYEILSESIDCIYWLRSFPIVQRVTIEPGKLIVAVKYKNLLATMPLVCLLIDKQFKEYVQSPALLDAMDLLDKRLKTYIGLDAELQEEIENADADAEIENVDADVERGKTKTRLPVQTSLGVNDFDRLPQNIQQQLIVQGRKALGYLENLAFVNAVTLSNDAIWINYNSSTKITVVGSLAALISSATFQSQLEYYSAKADDLMSSFVELISTVKKYDGYLAALRSVNTKNVEVNVLSDDDEKELDKLRPYLESQEDIDMYRKIWKSKRIGKNIKKAVSAFMTYKKTQSSARAEYLEKASRAEAESVFDDAPACGKHSTRKIVDRFENVESSDEDKAYDEEYTANEAEHMLESYFNDYSFLIDLEGDDCESFFTDKEGIERPLKDLKTEIASISNAKTRKHLTNALALLLDITG